MLKEHRRRHQEPPGPQQGQAKEGNKKRPHHVPLEKRVVERAQRARWLREKLEEDVAAGTAELPVKLEVIDVAGIQPRADDLGAEEQPCGGGEYRREIPARLPCAAAFPILENSHGAKYHEQGRHVLLDAQDGEEPQPIPSAPFREPGFDKQQDQRRGERFGMKLVNRDRKAGGGEQRRQREKESGPPFQAEALSDAPGGERHRGKRRGLRGHERHGMGA